LFTANDVGGKPVTFSAEGKKQSSAEDAEAFLKSCIGANYTVSDIQVRTRKKITCSPFYYFHIAARSIQETWLWCKPYNDTCTKAL
jgi:hypothetical protein